MALKRAFSTIDNSLYVVWFQPGSRPEFTVLHVFGGLGLRGL